MVIDVLFFVIGFGAVCVVTGGFREIICFGTFAGFKILDISISAFESPFGGFILVGIMAGMFRALYNFMRNRRIKQNAEAQNIAAAGSVKAEDEDTHSPLPEHIG